MTPPKKQPIPSLAEMLRDDANIKEFRNLADACAQEQITNWAEVYKPPFDGVTFFAATGFALLLGLLSWWGMTVKLSDQTQYAGRWQNDTNNDIARLQGRVFALENAAKPAADPGAVNEHELDLAISTKCWLSVRQEGGPVLSEGTLTAGSLKSFQFFTPTTIIVRDGCPGAIKYVADGNPVSPKNEAKNPKDIELVRLEL